MRVRRGLFVLLAAALPVTALAAPASAGTGPSQICSNGIGYQEIPVPNGVVTIGAQLRYAPTSTDNQLVVCFSNTRPDIPSTATGGALVVEFGAPGTTSARTVYANLSCPDDTGPQTVDLGNAPFGNCGLANGVSVVLGGSTTVVPAGCLLFNPLNGTCLYYNPSPVALPVPAIYVLVLNTPIL